jgi:ABC-type glutathione transport system ATPase component
MASTTDIILRTENLKKYFPVRKGLNPFHRREQRFVRAVDGVSISIQKGKTAAIVGESGCGKTTLARTIGLMTQPTGGKLYFGEKEITASKVDRNEIYRNMQMVYQDPESSLDPRMKIGQSIGEPLYGLMGWKKDVVQEAVRFRGTYTPTTKRRTKTAGSYRKSNSDSTLARNSRRTYERLGRLRTSADPQTAP